MENMLSEKRCGDSEPSRPLPRFCSLSFNLVAERWCCESPVGVLEDDGWAWPSGVVTETTGMGVSRLTKGSAASSAMVHRFGVW